MTRAACGGSQPQPAPRRTRRQRRRHEDPVAHASAPSGRAPTPRPKAAQTSPWSNHDHPGHGQEDGGAGLGRVDASKSGLNALLAYIDNPRLGKIIEARNKLNDGESTAHAGMSGDLLAVRVVNGLKNCFLIVFPGAATVAASVRGGSTLAPPTVT